MSSGELLQQSQTKAAHADDQDLNQTWPTDVTLIAREDLSDDQLQTIERLAYQHGSAPESYNVIVSDSAVLFTPCGRGVVSVLPDGKCWHIPGGILAPDKLRPRIVKWLKAVSDTTGKTLLLYSIRDTWMPLFRDAGFEVNMLGIEPIIELGDVTWSGSKLSWVRRQTSFCQRAGLEIVEIDDEAERLAMADNLNEILMEDLADRAFPKPLRLLEGEFDPHCLKRRRLFVARQKEDKSVCGFLACSPMMDGAEWAFETYRKRKDAPRGTVAFLFRTVIDQLQSEGAKRVSLCLVPGKYVDHPDHAIGPAVPRHLMNISYRYMPFVFNIQGQDYFKQRFRPAEECRYTCVSTVSSFGTLFSFLKTTGALVPNLKNVSKNIWHMIRSKFRKK